ncbi:MAG: glutamate--tRNA ligase [Sphaerochaetaceae bacterium]|nr:glutamate--tRNA ligase [Sphaerochaetaceae bacterium]
MSVRVRYAPSPTGLQHIGGVRTALFNYFFARANKGSFILRIEDTDRERSTNESIQDLYDTLNWLGIEWDEGPVVGGEYGPYIQSERSRLYAQYADQLIADGKAYRCFCTPERLDALREEQEKTKSKEKGYDRHCRNLSEEEIAHNLAQNMPYVVRLKVPTEGKTSFEDVLMGTITRKNKDVNPDPVLLKSDGFPTYHLANVIDDHLMGITHIMRAQEWIPSGPLHILLYEAFGWTPPLYCHLPMVMGKDGQKLSKRHGSTAVRDFREKGYLPEALMNYVSMVGWSYDDKREFFSKEEFCELFSLEKINKAPGIFDYKKLEWYNGIYIREKRDEELAALLLPYLKEAGFVGSQVSEQESSFFLSIMPLIKERLKVLSDVIPLTRFLYQEVAVEDVQEFVPKKQSLGDTAVALARAYEILKAHAGEAVEILEEQLVEVSKELGLKVNGVFMPIRVAVTGSQVSPPLFDSIRALGWEKALQRIEDGVKMLEGEVDDE